MSRTSKNFCWSRSRAHFIECGRAFFARLNTEIRLHRSIGRWGERVARYHLKKNGLLVVTTNWRASRLEADIILIDHRTIAVVEVKTRHSRLMHTYPGIAAVTQQKYHHLSSLLKRFMRNHGPLCRRFSLRNHRIDIIEVYYMRGRFGQRKVTALKWHVGVRRSTLL